MNLDPRIVSALVGVVAVLVSAIVSYFVSRKIENKKSTIEYLKGKIVALEEKKKLLVGLDFEDLGEDVSKDNLIEKYQKSIGKRFNVSVQNFRHIDHYFVPSFVAELNARIEKANLALGAENLEELAGRKIPDEWAADILRSDNIGKEMTKISKVIIRVVSDELRMSVASLEKLSGLKK